MSTANNKGIHAFRDVFQFGCLGVLIGILIIGFAEARISYQQITQMRQALIARFNTNSETQYLLAKAFYAGVKGESENVISMLEPNLSKFTDRGEAAEAYSLLGTAEYALGRPQLAAGYFELMYANNPISHNLYTLALAYDKGGNFDTALQKYALIVAYQDGTVQPNEIAYAQQRILEIMKLKGISVPNQ